jgi:hypothetical protein
MSYGNRWHRSSIPPQGRRELPEDLQEPISATSTLWLSRTVYHDFTTQLSKQLVQFLNSKKVSYLHFLRQK